MNNTASFETTYTRYPFAPLVDLGLSFVIWLKWTVNIAGKSLRTNRRTGPGVSMAGHTTGHAG